MTIQALQELTDKVNEAKRAQREFAQTSGKEVIGAAFVSILQDCPTISHVSWTQYTPGFNDGDPCRFGVHGLCVVPVDNEEDYDDREFESESDSEKHPEDKLRQLHSLFRSLDESLLEDVFGDGVKIKIDSENLTVEDYDCGY
jgi:hypothetical protein